MSGLTAPPLVLLRSLSRVPSRINSRLSADLDLSLDPARLGQLAHTNVSSTLLMPGQQAGGRAGRQRNGRAGATARNLPLPQDPKPAGDPGPSEKVTAHTLPPTPPPDLPSPLFRIKVTPIPKKGGLQVIKV